MEKRDDSHIDREREREKRVSGRERETDSEYLY